MEKKNSKKVLFFCLGIIISILTCVPFFVLGKESIITYHDQLDGEILTYLFHAKYLFQGVNRYAEIMNGINAAGLAMPAPLFVVLYRLFSPFTAVVLSIIVIKIVGFSGTFLLIDELTDNWFIAFLCGLGFMLLPFYFVYGLCIPGEPILIYALIRLYKKDEKPVLSWTIILLYSLSSSLALVGFAWIIALTVITVICGFRRTNFTRFFVALGIMGITYATVNLDLVKQLLGVGETVVSHKSEIIKGSSGFGTALADAFFSGAEYTKVEQMTFLPGILISIILVLVVKRCTGNLGGKVKKETACLAGGLCINFALSLLYALYVSKPVVDFCNSSQGILHEFNFGRIIWLNSGVWVALLGVSLALIKDSIDALREFASEEGKIFKGRKAVSVLYVLFLLGTIGCFSFMGFYKSDLKSNVMKLIKKDYYMMTYEQFFAEDLFDEVENLIGLNKDEYRVVSLGIYPSAASYNGFYCLDAYSNNYDVEYKHEFRKIIARELEKSDYLREWFDDWGNRCYIVLNESNNYFTFEKRWIPTSAEVDLDLEQLRKMGCNYIISASYILDCEKYGMNLLNEEPIQTEESWYRLWVYQF